MRPWLVPTIVAPSSSATWEAASAPSGRPRPSTSGPCRQSPLGTCARRRQLRGSPAQTWSSTRCSTALASSPRPTRRSASRASPCTQTNACSSKPCSGSTGQAWSMGMASPVFSPCSRGSSGRRPAATRRPPARPRARVIPAWLAWRSCERRPRRRYLARCRATGPSSTSTHVGPSAATAGGAVPGSVLPYRVCS